MDKPGGQNYILGSCNWMQQRARKRGSKQVGEVRSPARSFGCKIAVKMEAGHADT